MSKKIILILFGFILFFGARFVYAEVVINEVQIGGVSANDEFIELYNSSDSDVDLTGWYINKKSSTGTESALVAKSRLEGKSIKANSYFLLARESGYMGNASPDVFWPASYSLASNNYLILYRGNDIDKDQTNWMEIEDGKSVQKTGSGWIIATSTPGEENEISENVEENSNTDNDNSDSTSGSSSTKKTETEEPKIPLVNKTKIIASVPVFAGLPVEFKISNTVSNKPCGKYFLNFGDGDFLETPKTFSIPEKFTHIYYYTGEYIVKLECYESYLSSKPDSSDKIIVKVISSEVVISKVGDAQDFFIEISNNAPYEADISNWVLSSYQNKFIFPKNSILKSKNKIIVSPKTTNFSILDRDTLALINSEGEIMSHYASSFKPIRTLTQNSSSVGTKSSLGGETAKLEDEEIFSENLEASAIKSDSNMGNNIIYGIGLFAFLGASASGAYFIRGRKKRDTFGPIGNNFEIIDE